MNPTQEQIDRLYEAAGKAITEARGILDDPKHTAEDAVRAETLMNECGAKQKQARELQRMDELAAAQGKALDARRLPVGGERTGVPAAKDRRGLPSFVQQAGADDLAEAKAFNAALRSTLTAEDRGILDGIRAKTALNEGTTTQGGFLTPDIYTQDLIKALYYPSFMRAAGAHQITLTSDNTRLTSLTASAAAVLTSEANSFDEKEPTLGETVFVPYKSTRLALASQEVVNDSRFDLWGNVLAPDFAQAFAAYENTYFTTGSGTSQPQGVVTGASTGVTCASTTIFTGDEVIKLFFSLNYLYRQRPTAAFMMNDAVLSPLRTLKDAFGRYLWDPGLNGATMDQLLGKQLIINNSMSSTLTTGQKLMLFGDFSYYWIGDREGLQIMVLNELYAATGQIGYRAYKRSDAHVMLAAAFQLLVLG